MVTLKLEHVCIDERAIFSDVGRLLDLRLLRNCDFATLRHGGRSNLRGGNLNNICMIFMQLVAFGAMAPV